MRYSLGLLLLSSSCSLPGVTDLCVGLIDLETGTLMEYIRKAHVLHKSYHMAWSPLEIHVTIFIIEGIKVPTMSDDMTAKLPT
jgi:hypothetical protein